MPRERWQSVHSSRMRDGGSRHYRSTGRETRFNDQTAGQSPKTPIQYLIRSNESQPSTLSQSRSRRARQALPGCRRGGVVLARRGPRPRGRPGRGSQVRSGLAAGGRWIRTIGPPAKSVTLQNRSPCKGVGPVAGNCRDVLPVPEMPQFDAPGMPRSAST
jgi:hypothetical protein